MEELRSATPPVLRPTQGAGRNSSIEIFICDVDGCLTDGRFGWSQRGEKLFKLFGPDDAAALRELKQYMQVLLVSADRVGWGISKTRADHMEIEFAHARERERLEDIEKLARERGALHLGEVAYMGDGRHDAPALQACGVGICPRDAAEQARLSADYICSAPGGFRAVSEAVDYLIRQR